MAAGESWQLNPSCQLHWRRWGEQIVLFNASSGQTHFVNEFTYHLIQALGDGAFDSGELSALFIDDDLTDDALRRHVDELIATLDELGIVEPARS